MALRTHKIALRPNREQEAWFQSQSGYSRFAFNNALSDFIAGLEVGEFRSFVDLNNRLNGRKHAYDWVKAQDQRAAVNLKHLAVGQAESLNACGV